MSLTILASEIDWTKPRPPAPERGYVYFMLTAETSRMKIGRAQDPAARLRQVGAHCAEELHLVGLVPSAMPSHLEANLHRRFAAHRLHAEWFDPTLDMLNWIETYALTGGDVSAELFPDERPEGWRRPHLPSPRW